MDEVIAQAPIHISFDDIKRIFEKHNHCVIDTLTELWDIKESLPKQKNKWENIRETCDAFDYEMSRCIKKTQIYDGNTMTTNIELK
jgi:hypothetical protein